MIALGLSAADQRKFEAGLLIDHQIAVRVATLDLNEKVIGVIESSPTQRGGTISGQVDIDTTQQVDRTCSVQVYDPENRLGFDEGDPHSADSAPRRMVRIHYGVWSVSYPQWVWVPVFTGNVEKATRDGASVSVTGVGKESMTLEAASYNQTYPKGSYKTSIIANLLRRNGETNLDIPSWRDKSTTNTVVAPLTQPWLLAQQIGRSFGSVRLGYDGRGTARLVNYATSPRWTFRGGDGGSLLSVPKITPDLTKARNLIVVTGATPAGAKAPITYIAKAPAKHPLSASPVYGLGRNGVERHLRLDVNENSVTSQAAAKKLGDALLAEHLQAAMSVTFDALVIPHLEPYDMVAVDAGEWTWSAPLQQATIPLTPDAAMSIGRIYSTGNILRRAGR